MHEYPVFGASMTSVSNQDYVKHVLSPGRLQDLKKSAVSIKTLMHMIFYATMLC